MKNEKMIKNSETIDKFMNLGEKILLAGGIVVFIMMILVAFLGEKMIADPNNISLGGLSIVLNDGCEPQLSSMKGSVEMLLLPAFVLIAVSWYGIRMLRKVLSPMKEGRPFEKSSSANIRKLGIFVIIGGVLLNICQMIAATMEQSLCNKCGVFNMDVVKSTSVDYSFDISFIFVALVVFLLALVFKYGEELQTESDETL